jgi:hypothetical protein
MKKTKFFLEGIPMPKNNSIAPNALLKIIYDLVSLFVKRDVRRLRK